MQFALDEILNSTTLGTDHVKLNDQISIQNPVKNVLKIKSQSYVKDAEITITDTSGRKIVNKINQILSGITEIPLSLTDGIYIMTIKYGTEIMTKKIIVKK